MPGATLANDPMETLKNMPGEVKNGRFCFCLETGEIHVPPRGN